ncbi:MAG: SRPBCC family protein [Nitrospinota bacterium]
MKFNALGLVKHPVDQVWMAMRDDLPSMVGLIDDIESIQVVSRDEEDENLHVVNVWKAVPPTPKIVSKFIDSKMFVWTDEAKWDKGTRSCKWVIEPHSFKKYISCEGSTFFTSAMGGRGTRVTFSGEIHLKSRKIPGIPVSIEGRVMSGIEGFVQNLIPKNFRKIIDAIGKHLGSGKPQTQISV